MPNKGNNKIEFRYYKMPDDVPFLALFGERWNRQYGKGIDYLHFHNYLEIGYCYEGTGTLIIGKETHRFEKNCFSVIPQNCVHTTNSDPDTISYWEYLFIDIDALLAQVYRNNIRQISQIASRINSKAFFKKEQKNPKIGQTIRLILNLMHRKEEFYLEEAKAEIIVLLLNIARTNSASHLPEKLPAKDTLPIAQSLDFISTHYMEPLKVEDLASNCHLSESHFRKIFSSYMGMGPVEYINMVRIRAACDLLKRTDDFVSDIANKCGFATFSTFIRNFKKIMGVSPNEWRKRPDNYEQQLLKAQIHMENGW